MVKQQSNKQTSNKQAKTNMLLAQNEFSAALFKKSNSDDCNLIISPFSIYMAFLSCMMGTNGQTLNEMVAGLFLTDSFDSCKMETLEKQFQKWKETELKQYSTMIKKIVEVEGILSIANRIYVEKSLSIRNDFLQELDDKFDSQTQLANFKSNPEGEKQKINEWVSSKTNNSIKNLISYLDKDALMVIVNAIHFNGKWKHQFNKNRTVEKSFRTVTDPMGESIQQCQMMRLEDHKSKFYYGEIDDYQILQLPYTNDEYCMTFIKPDDDSVELNEETELSFNSWITSKLSDVSELAPKEKVKMRKIQIPKFKFEKQFDNLIPIMEQEPFNINSLFYNSKSDFSNMFTSKEGAFVNQVIHMACIEVDECGTVASAATAMSTKRKRQVNQEVFEFVADRPFVFILQHVPTQSILFVGKINQV